MLVGKAIHTAAQVLTKTDSVADALELMDSLEVGNLPVINPMTHKLEGQVSAAILRNADNLGMSIAEMKWEEPVIIYEHQHLFHAIRLMLQYELRLLPVINDEWIFQGIILKQQVLESLSEMLNLNEYGSIITVQLEQQDFSLSQIVQIIETEEGKILGITVETPDAEKSVYEVSIKINLKDLSRVASALRRYGYTILTEAENESYRFDMETRADELLNYLDM